MRIFSVEAEKSRLRSQWRSEKRRALKLLRKHGTHDQSTHGSWADGVGKDDESKGRKSVSNAAKLYTPTTKTADQIVAGFPGGAEAINHARELLKSVVETNKPVAEGGFKQPDGSYTPERSSLHQAIVDHFINPDTASKYLPAAGENPTLTVLGGRGGSGKSWLTKQGSGPIDKERSLVIDSDEIKSMLPEYEGWNAAQLHEESSEIADLIDIAAAKLGLNVVLDGTLKSTNITKRMAVYQEARDYELEGYYMYASPETAATRAMQRYATGGTFKGRFVPPEVILGNTKNEENFDKLSSSFSKWAVYDNDQEGGDPILVEQGGRGRKQAK